MDRAHGLAITARRRLAIPLGIPLAVVLSGCTLIGSASTVLPPPPPAGIADVTPRAEPPARSGNMLEYEQNGRWYRVLDSSSGYDERGVASWYGEFFDGRPTSSGEIFDMYALSAAHRTLPIPTYVRVTNLGNGLSVILRVNDRGPFADPDTRIIDVSYAAAIRLGMAREGTANVRIQAVEPWQSRLR